MGALRSQATMAPQHSSATYPVPILPKSEKVATDSRSRNDMAPYIANRLHLREPFWRRVERWKGVRDAEFLSYEWQVRTRP